MEARYTPYGNLQDVFYAHDREVLVEGPAGTGKSRAILEKLVYLALTYERCRILIARKTRESINSSVAVTLKDEVIPHLLSSGHVIHKGASSKQPAQYEFTTTGSVILTAGMDDPEKIKSTQFDLIFVNEATELDEQDWLILLTRLRNNKIPNMQIIADCNPSYPYHWLKKRADSGKMRRIITTHKDNPVYWQNDHWTPVGQAYLKTLDSMTGVQRERMYLGKWAANEGLVYDTFSPEVHVTDTTIPDGWPRYWSVDFGYNDAFVCQMWAMDPDGSIYLENEVFMTGRTVLEHCKTLKPYAESHRPRAVICDSSSPEHMEQMRRELHLNVVGVKKGKDSVLKGIGMVKDRLSQPSIFFRPNSLIATDRRLSASNNPVRTIDEFLSYSWNKNNPEVPEDKFNHGMDAMRYIVMYLGRHKPVQLRFLNY